MSWTNLMPQAVAQNQAAIVYAQVSDQMPLPQGFGDVLYVVQADWSPDFFFPITNWPAIHGATLPAPGAEVLMLQDPRGNWRVVWWDGAYADFRQAIVEETTTSDSVTLSLA